MKQHDTPTLYKCPACGQWVKSERYKMESYVFVWTTMTVLLWSMLLVSSRGQSLAWWAQRRDLVVIFACIPVVAVYFWVQYLRERKK